MKVALIGFVSLLATVCFAASSGNAERKLSPAIAATEQMHLIVLFRSERPTRLTPISGTRGGRLQIAASPEQPLLI